MDTQIWEDAAKRVHWYSAPRQLIDTDRSPFNRWFPDGTTNACYNALDLHVAEGNEDRIALIHDSPVTDSKKRISYGELLETVSRFAGALSELGISKGDRVIIYMPMVPEAIVSMLACARIGAIHCVVFGGFASKELAVRIDDAEPKLIISASCGVEPSRTVPYKPLLDDAIEQARHKPEHCIVLQRPMLNADLIAPRDLDWNDVISNAEPVDCLEVESGHPLYILYTSGTTGQPKGVVRDTGGHIVALKWSMSSIYDVKPGDVYWAASDVGWVVGHSYIVYGPLFHGNTTVLYEGKPVGTPDPGAFWRVIAEHKVSVMFTAPTALRAIKREDPEGVYVDQYDLSSLQSLFLAGERCDPDTLHWAESHLKVPVIDHWWQTETGWSICANCLGIEKRPVVPGSPGRPVPGYHVEVLDVDGNTVSDGNIGALVVLLPLPPGNFTTLWNGEERFLTSYFEKFPGYYETGDSGYIDKDGHVFVMARTDDVINVAGHRLSTGAMEEVLTAHPDVAECAVFGVADQLKGQLPLGLIVLNSNVARDAGEITAECIAKVRNDIGPVASFKLCGVVNRLPKTRSGKILRGTMRCIADKTDWEMPATIEDTSALDGVTQALELLGYA